MKRIGIITIWQVNNYGAELQAYALVKKINEFGHKCENIDFPFYKNHSFKLTKRGRTPFPIGWRNTIKEFLLPKISTVLSLSHPIENKTRKNNFERFYQITPHSAKRFLSFDDLYSHKDFKYDVYMVGSDQVWNPRSLATIEPYFLTFAPKDAKKISYASSFGISDIPKECVEKFRNWLNSLDAISVREKNGVNLVERIASKHAIQVLDPVFLLDAEEWRKVAVCPDIKEPYLLLYDLIKSDETVDLAKKIGKTRKLKIVRLCRDVSIHKDNGIQSIPDAGPMEFLGLFANASFVVTNSFHGTAFSLIFHKNFYSIIPNKMNNSGRIKSILELVDLQSRLLPAQTVDTCNTITDVDFSKATQLLQNAREESINFLTKELEQ